MVHHIHTPTTLPLRPTHHEKRTHNTRNDNPRIDQKFKKSSLRAQKPHQKSTVLLLSHGSTNPHKDHKQSVADSKNLLEKRVWLLSFLKSPSELFHLEKKTTFCTKKESQHQYPSCGSINNDSVDDKRLKMPRQRSKRGNTRPCYYLINHHRSKTGAQENIQTTTQKRRPNINTVYSRVVKL